MTNLNDNNEIRAELNHHNVIFLYRDEDYEPDEADFDISEHDPVTQLDEYVYRLDIAEHGATVQVYGFYTFDGALRTALAGVQGEEFTMIYINKEV